MRQFVRFDVIAPLSKVCRLRLVGGVLGLAPAVLVPAAADDIASTVMASESDESSVVVAKRKLENATTLADANAETLQPISTLSDKEPQLADPEPTLAAMPGGSKVPAKPPVKVASNTAAADAGTTPASQAPQPAVFHGMQPGVSTKKQLIESWGSPDEVAPTELGQILTYDMESFRGVEVLVEDGLVTLIKINLRTPVAPTELAAKVQAAASEAAKVTDPQTGWIAAYAYPERGIVMVVDESADITPDAAELVSQMILQPLDAEAFCLRAEARPFGELAMRIADLQQATTLAPRESHAHWLLARVLLDAGRGTEAEAAAKRAIDLDPENLAYRQRWGEALVAVGKYDEAVLTTREVLDATDAPTLVRGLALHQMGELASMGNASISDKAISFYTMAIAEADKLATSDNAIDRRYAKRLLVEAHLAIAVDISRREYNDKMDNVAQWVSRASAFAEEAIENDNGDLGMRIRVAQQSLAALSNFKPANDPNPLIQEINETLKTIKKDAHDPLWMDQLEWTSGMAYLHALKIEHHRRRPKQALEYSERAIELLADKAEDRRDNPQTERLVGELYFHIGAVHAVHESQHGKAVEWYDRAFPLLMTESADSELVVPRHEGEALVSMAVSYWDQGDRDRAVSLTEMGADLIEQAVAGGVIVRKNLAVPYGNLAVMHKKLGNSSESQRYAKLAESSNVPDENPTQAEAPPTVEGKSPGVAANKQAVPPKTARRPSAVRRPQPQPQPQPQPSPAASPFMYRGARGRTSQR